jgi:hypothetical protein
MRERLQPGDEFVILASDGLVRWVLVLVGGWVGGVVVLVGGWVGGVGWGGVEGGVVAAR